MDEVNIAKVAMIANAILWGLIWWPLRRLGAEGVNPLLGTAVGYLAGAIGITLICRHAWRELLALRRLWLIGLASGLSIATFNWAVTVDNVARVVFLFYLMPVWAVLLGRWLLKERMTPRSTACLAVALIGCIVVLWPGGQGSLQHRAPLADMLAVSSGFFFALGNVLLRRNAHSSSASAATLALFGGGSLISAIAGALLGGIHSIPSIAAPMMALVDLTLLATLLVASTISLPYGAASLPAAVTACIMLLEVAVASLSSSAANASEFNLRLLIGGGLIFTAAAGMVMRATPGGAVDRHERAKPGVPAIRTTKA